MVSVETTFKGTGTMGTMTYDISWSFTSVSGENFQFKQFLYFHGDLFSNSNGEGTFTQSGDIVNLTFSDLQTNYTGVYNVASGSFTGTSAKKNGSGTGSFNLTRE